MKIAGLLLLVCLNAQAVNFSDDIRIYYPNGRASFFGQCEVTQDDAVAIVSTCYGRFENQPGVNPIPATGLEVPFSIVITEASAGLWSVVDETLTCVQTGTYAVPFPGHGYITQCTSNNFIYGDTFDGDPLGGGHL